MTGARMNRIWWRDSASTWPSLRVEIQLLPWHWRLLPRAEYDYSPKCWDEEPIERRAGWWGLTGEWLMVEAHFGFNLPPFTLERAIESEGA